MQRICEWDFGPTCLDDPHRPEKSSLSKRPTKMAQQGLVCEQGVFPYSGGESRTQAHTGGTAEAIRFRCYQSSKFLFSAPVLKAFFFVYAAQFLHKAILLSSTLITFYRTLLEYYGSLFCFLRCDRMRFLKVPQNWPK